MLFSGLPFEHALCPPLKIMPPGILTYFIHKSVKICIHRHTVKLLAANASNSAKHTCVVLVLSEPSSGISFVFQACVTLTFRCKSNGVAFSCLPGLVWRMRRVFLHIPSPLQYFLSCQDGRGMPGSHHGTGARAIPVCLIILLR